MKKRLVGSAAIATISLVLSVVPAHAASLTAYEDANFKRPLITHYYADNRLDVADNRTSSITNSFNNDYSARNNTSWMASTEVYYVRRGARVKYVGNKANDKIDHFDRR